MTNRYFDWLLNLLALALVLATVLPSWPWPFDYWPGGPIGGLATFIWVAMLAMDFIERKTGYYWITKVSALLALLVFASLASS